jgi:hypothetical protein
VSLSKRSLRERWFNCLAKIDHRPLLRLLQAFREVEACLTRLFFCGIRLSASSFVTCVAADTYSTQGFAAETDVRPFLPPSTSDRAIGIPALLSRERTEPRMFPSEGMLSITKPFSDATVAPSSACEKCGIPKTFSTALGGLVCPQCKGREPGPPRQETGKRKTFVKDKEKDKRMKGQSVHASWKSEGEMLLRQQFD